MMSKMSASDQPRYEPLTIHVNFEKQGYGTSTRHGQSIDIRLHRPIPTLANVKEGDAFVVYIERSKKALLLVRASELNNRDKVQQTFGALQATRLLTPEFMKQTISLAANAEGAAIYEKMGRRKPKTRIIHKRK